MAVYTEVASDALERFLTAYDLGALRAVKGIAEGVENSNYLLRTDAGAFILTLYEKRVREDDLPFFLALLEHLAARGLHCPQPVRDRMGKTLGRLAGRPAVIVTFIDGVSVRQPGTAHCAALGAALAHLHEAGADFPMRRQNALSLDGWAPLFGPVAARADEVEAGLQRLIAEELAFLATRWPDALPTGLIHADLFPDNVFFLGDRLTGLIDFYFACTDALAYDVAVCLNAWCFDEHEAWVPARGEALLAAYESVRRLSEAEAAGLPVLARGAALRFALTRLVDWLDVPPGALVKPKDPLEYVRRLRFHQGVGNAGAYGLKR